VVYYFYLDLYIHFGFPLARLKWRILLKSVRLPLQVADAGSMTAFTNAAIVQLLEVDVENAAFKFYATAVGKVDIRLVFAQKDMLQITTATVQVEVIDDDSGNVQKLGELQA
jgi:hypothetical protein